MDSKTRKTSATVLLLGITSFLNDLSSEMIMPILPMFITALGGGGVAVGLTGGVRDSMVSLLKVYSGFISDRTGRRKPLVTAGYSISSVFKVLLSFSTAWWHVLVFTGLERIGKGLRTAPRDAMIAESMPQARGKGFGIHRALDSMGATTGSAVALLLLWYGEMDFHTIILIAGFISIVSLVPLLWVKDTRKRPVAITLRISLKGLPRRLKVFILVSSLFTLANISYMFFILRTQDYFSESLAVVIPVVFYIIFNISYAASSVPFGVLSDRIGKRRTILLGYLLFSVVTLGFVSAHSTVALVILFLLYGVAMAIVDACQRAFVSELSGSELRGTGLGAFHTVMGLMALPSGLVAGLLWEASPQFTFLYAAILAFLSAVLLLLFKGYLVEPERA